MGIPKVIITVALLALVVVAVVAPIGPLPGFFIGGERTAPRRQDILRQQPTDSGPRGE